MDKKGHFVRAYYLLLIKKENKYNIDKDNNIVEIIMKDMDENKKKQLLELQGYLKNKKNTQHVIVIKYGNEDDSIPDNLYNIIDDALYVDVIKDIEIIDNKVILKGRKYSKS